VLTFLKIARVIFANVRVLVHRRDQKCARMEAAALKCTLVWNAHMMTLAVLAAQVVAAVVVAVISMVTAALAVQVVGMKAVQVAMLITVTKEALAVAMKKALAVAIKEALVMATKEALVMATKEALVMATKEALAAAMKEALVMVREALVVRMKMAMAVVLALLVVVIAAVVVVDTVVAPAMNGAMMEAVPALMKGRMMGSATRKMQIFLKVKSLALSSFLQWVCWQGSSLFVDLRWCFLSTLLQQKACLCSQQAVSSPLEFVETC